MDSPGNDLESIAGQVASGSNVIVFTTGNGAITNFPFVPTVKVLTTTTRYELLSKDMDVNAGSYLDGTRTMAELGEDTLKYILRAASGKKTKGELAGHHQVFFILLPSPPLFFYPIRECVYRTLIIICTSATRVHMHQCTCMNARPHTRVHTDRYANTVLLIVSRCNPRCTSGASGSVWTQALRTLAGRTASRRPSKATLPSRRSKATVQETASHSSGGPWRRRVTAMIPTQPRCWPNSRACR
jgi:hypothetical protein